MRRVVVVLALIVAILGMLAAAPASASIHPLVCSTVRAQGNGSPTGDIANPPGLTPNDADHDDPLEAADGVADFAPLVAHIFKANPNAMAHAWKGPGSCGT